MQLTSKPRQLPPEGTHTAILYQFIDIGTQKTDQQGQIKINRKFRYTWELCEELMEDGRPFAISKTYNASAHPKSAIAKDIKAWTGTVVTSGFNPAELIGTPCNITITHDSGTDGSEYANVAAIGPLKKSEKAPPQRNASVVFDLDSFDQSVFDKLPDFMKEAIQTSPEYIEAVNPAAKQHTKQAQPIDDTEIPF